jgi:adenosylcobinamide-GDP ribazoletransferase
VPELRPALDRFTQRYLAALRLATRIRAPMAGDAPAAEGLAHLPGVGWILGIAGCLTFAIVAILLRGNPYAPAVAAVVACVVAALLTGARNEVALQEWLRPAGTVAVVILLLARVLLLAAIGAMAERSVIAVLFAAPVVSRFIPLAVAHWNQGTSAPRGALRLPALWCLVPLLLLVPAGGVRLLLLAMLGTALAMLAMVRAARSEERAGFDGALQQVCEAGFYLGAAIAA